MTRIEKLMKRVETLEFELAHLAGTAFHVGPLNIASRIMLRGILSQVDDEALDAIARYCLGEAERQKAEGLAGFAKIGATRQDVTDFITMHDEAARDLKSMIDGEKRRRSGS